MGFPSLGFGIVVEDKPDELVTNVPAVLVS